MILNPGNAPKFNKDLEERSHHQDMSVLYETETTTSTFSKTHSYICIFVFVGQLRPHLADAFAVEI